MDPYEYIVNLSKDFIPLAEETGMIQPIGRGLRRPAASRVGPDRHEQGRHQGSPQDSRAQGKRHRHDQEPQETGGRERGSTAEQYALLKDMRGDLMQGYYFSRRLPAPAFEKLLARDAALPAPGG